MSGDSPSEPGRPPRWTLEKADADRAPFLHPIAGANFRIFLRHWFQNGHFSRRSRGQRFSAWALHLLRWPSTVFEKLWWRRAIRDHRIEHPPVFLIGHWRSGTTHLHNLLSKDPQFGFIDFGETTMPGNMLGPKARIGRAAVRKVIPPTRGYDNVRLSLEDPQEEEMALGNLSPIGFFNAYYFPRRMRELARHALLLEGATEKDREAFERAYDFLIRKLSYAKGGRQMLFKNPSSTARIPLLKKLYPDAKFIHMVRNPYPVYRSSIGKFPRLFSAFAWQDFLDLGDEIHDLTIELYVDMMKRYLKDREILEPADLYETSYEKITEDPLGEIGRIYDQLGIDGKTEALEHIGHYVEDIRDYRGNVHHISAEHADEIQEKWGFSFREWGYPLEPPDDIEVQ